MTVMETSTLGAKTTLQSVTGNPQAQALPPNSLRLPLGLGLGLGLAVLLVVGIGVLVLYMRRKASENKQKQGEEHETVKEQGYELGGTQRAEMDVAVGRTQRSELSKGTRGMPELEATSGGLVKGRGG